MVDPRVFRTYDIRALVPELVDEDSAYHGQLDDPNCYQAPIDTAGVERIGRGLARLFDAPVVAVGADTRISSPAWKDALAAGLTAQGVDVWDLGLTPTDMVYYVSGKYGLPAVQITASHCTRELNGMKMVRAGAHVVGRGSGMDELREIVLGGDFGQAARRGTVLQKDLLREYVDHLLTFVNPEEIRPFRILGDAGNGVGGVVAHALVARLLQVRMEEMYFEPDGRFPNHDANPFETENIHELMARVPAEGFDFGVAWDGDADRVFFIDEQGRYVHGDFITTLLARCFLETNPGASIVYDLRASWAVADWVERLGGKAIPERVGHSFIKRTMRAENAVFGGEVSGHYYFRDHYYADNGYIPLLAVLTMLSRSGQKMSELVASLGEYHVSGEINSTVADTKAAIARVAERYADGDIDYRDGITVSYPDWHCNVRPSANDPLVRMNVEARSHEEMERRRDELLAVIRGAA
jgi:phosphomannomutase